MIVALILLVLGGAVGWLLAQVGDAPFEVVFNGDTVQGGTTADRMQYAAAHGLPAFLLGMIAMTVAGHLGWLG